MNPTQGGEFGMATTGIGAGIKAFGDISGGFAQQQMYDYQAGVARMNAQIAEQNATYATQVGDIQAANAGLQGGQLMGRIKAAQSATGLDVNTGSALEVRKAQAGVTRQNVNAIVSNAAKTAYNYKVEGVQFQSQAQLDTLAGRNARTAGMIGGLSSIIGGASSISSEWLRGQQLGLWGAPQSGNGNSSQTFG